MRETSGRRSLVRYGLTWAIAVLVVCVFLTSCSKEQQADQAFRTAIANAEEMTIEEQMNALQEVVDRYPKSRAAKMASDELHAIREQQEAEAHGLQLLAWDSVRKVGRAAWQYRSRHGSYPASLEAMIPDFLDGPVLDPWGNEVAYFKTETDYQVFSYGEDGIPGGVGMAKDLWVEANQVQGE